jgi:hypothetical protein
VDGEETAYSCRKKISHALPEKHKRATVVRQIGQKLLQLFWDGIVLEHARRLVSLIRHRDVGLINSTKIEYLS